VGVAISDMGLRMENVILHGRSTLTTNACVATGRTNAHIYLENVYGWYAQTIFHIASDHPTLVNCAGSYYRTGLGICYDTAGKSPNDYAPMNISGTPYNVYATNIHFIAAQTGMYSDTVAVVDRVGRGAIGLLHIETTTPHYIVKYYGGAGLTIMKYQGSAPQTAVKTVGGFYDVEDSTATVILSGNRGSLLNSRNLSATPAFGVEFQMYCYIPNATVLSNGFNYFNATSYFTYDNTASFVCNWVVVPPSGIHLIGAFDKDLDSTRRMSVIIYNDSGEDITLTTGNCTLRIVAS